MLTHTARVLHKRKPHTHTALSCPKGGVVAARAPLILCRRVHKMSANVSSEIVWGLVRKNVGALVVFWRLSRSR